MATTDLATTVGAEFLDALERRDYAALAACFTPDATLRAIVPPGLREADGPEAIAERFAIWTSEIEDYELVETEMGPFADLLRLRWVVRGRDPGAEVSPSTFEQAAYAEVENGRITRLRLSCSGNRPV